MRFLFINVGHFQVHLFLLLYSTVVLVLEAEGGGSYGDLLLPSTALWIAFSACTLPAAWAGDRFSKVRLLTLMFFLLAAGGAIAAASSNAWMLTVGLALIGAGAAIYHPVGIALVTHEAKGTGKALGINGVWGNLGVAAAPVVAALISETLGWRWAFALPAVLALVTAFLHLRLERPEVHHSQSQEAEQPALLTTRNETLRIILFLVVSGFCGGLIFNALTIALPKLLSEALASDGALGPGALASVIFAVASFSQLYTGRLIDRHSARVLAGTLTGFQALTLAAMALTDGWLAVAAALVLVVAIFGEAPIGDTLVKRVTSPAIRARAYGVLYLVSFGSSIAAVPLIATLWNQGQGFGALLWILAGAGALLSAVAWSLPGRVARQE